MNYLIIIAVLVILFIIMFNNNQKESFYTTTGNFHDNPYYYNTPPFNSRYWRDYGHLDYAYTVAPKTVHTHVTHKSYPTIINTTPVVHTNSIAHKTYPLYTKKSKWFFSPIFVNTT